MGRKRSKLIPEVQLRRFYADPGHHDVALVHGDAKTIQKIVLHIQRQYGRHRWIEHVRGHVLEKVVIVVADRSVAAAEKAIRDGSGVGACSGDQISGLALSGIGLRSAGV